MYYRLYIVNGKANHKWSSSKTYLSHFVSEWVVIYIVTCDSYRRWESDILASVTTV